MSEDKEVAKRASNIQDKMNDVLKILTDKQNEEEVFETSGVKIGRPKIHIYKSCFEKKITKKSSYCTACHFIEKKSDHPKKYCKFAQMLFEIAKENQTSNKGQKCSIYEVLILKS